MRKSAGFTLIELVIVIVILGILGAVAAPKFLNLQGDAYSANVKSLAGSLQSATTLANTKAVLEGKDTGTGQDVDGYTGVKFDYGFPIAADNNTGILGALQSVPSASDYNITTDKVVASEGVAEKAATAVTLQPIARKEDTVSKCFVKYIQATGTNAPAKVEFDNDCE